jgi:hypothetical protein
VFTSDEPDTGGAGKKIWIVGGSVAATALIAGFAFFLGAWAFDTRQVLTHETRLQRLLARKPTLGQVVQGLEDEGSPLLASPVGDGELRAIATRHGSARVAEVVEKGRRWPTTRVFRAGEMVYFIYFDDAGVMRDYVRVPR